MKIEGVCVFTFSINLISKLQMNANQNALGSIHFLEGGGGGVGQRNPYEHECKISWPSLYILC